MEQLFSIVSPVFSAANKKSNKPESYPFSKGSLSPDHSDKSCMNRPLGSELSCTDAKKHNEGYDYVGLTEVSSFCENTDYCGGCEDGDLKLSLDLSLWVGNVEKKHNVPDSIETMQHAEILTKRDNRSPVKGLIGVKRRYNEAIGSNAQQRGQDNGVATGITPTVGRTRQAKFSAPAFFKKNRQENTDKCGGCEDGDLKLSLDLSLWVGDVEKKYNVPDSIGTMQHAEIHTKREFHCTDTFSDRNKANSLSLYWNTCRRSQPFEMKQSGMDLVNALCNLSQDKADHQLSGSDPRPVAGEPPTKQTLFNCLKGNSRYVKVNMDGVAIGRKVDLNSHESYEGLVQYLENMFQPITESQNGSRTPMGIQYGARSSSMRLLDRTSDMVLTYEDKDGDCMLVGDIPWKMFVNTVKRLRIMKTSKTNALG